MTDNEVLARWQGWKPRKGKTRLWLNPANQVKSHVQLPDYLNDDAAAMSLLDTLVEKGFDVRLQSFLEDPASDRWQCTVWYSPNETVGTDCSCIADVFKPIMREAIVAACLEVARKELDL